MASEPVEPDREATLSRLLAAWVAFVCKRARAVAWATALVAASLLGYAANNLGLTTSHLALLSDELPFWREYDAFAEVFPIPDEALFAVIDAETPDRARQAAEALAEELAGDTDLFEDVYVPGGGEFFERNALMYLSVEELEQLTDTLAGVQPLLAELGRDRSLRGLVKMLDDALEMAEREPAVAERLTTVFDSVSLAAETVLDGHPRPVSWIELLLDRKLPGESSRRLVVLEPRYDYDELLAAQRPIQAVRQAAVRLGLVPARGVEVRVTGNVALNLDEMLLVARQVLLGAAVASLVLVALVLSIAMGSRRLVGVVVATLLVGLIGTSAFAAVSVGSLNLVSVSFAVLFIGLGVDFGIHLGMRYAELLRGGFAHAAALEGTARSVGPSLVLCALTTMVGFYAFVPTDYRAVGELGLIAGTGMAISLFCSLTVFPGLLSLGDPGAVARGRAAPRWFTQVLIPLAVRRARAVRVAAALLFLGSLAVLPFARFDHNVVRMRDSSTESARTFEDLLSDSDTSPWNIEMLAPDLDAAVEIAEHLEGLDFVESAVTLRDYVPADQEEKLEILADLALFVPEPATYASPQVAPELSQQIAAMRSLRATLETLWLERGDEERRASARRAADQLDRFLARLETLDSKQPAVDSFERSLLGALPAQMRRLYDALDPEIIELESLPSDLSARMLAADGRARVQVLPAEDLYDNEAFLRFADGVRSEFPQATGSAVTLLEWGRATQASLRQALVSALVVIALIVSVLWRRLSDLSLVMAPLLLAASLTGATAVLVGIDFDFVNVIVLPLLLGIGVDSGIHLVHRHREAQRLDPEGAKGLDLLETSTAQAVFFSALTTIGSFGSLCFSTHGGIASMGQLLVIGVGWMLICNLVVLPALIAAPRRRAGG